MTERVGMTPVYFDGCFGWIHARSGAAAGATPAGVVLCPAFAQEEVCTHHGMMALADRLAAAGVPAIRFDYRDTGDGIGDGDGVALDRLVADARSAAAVLRDQCGVGAIVMAGVRLGAAVALLAADGVDDVGALALIAPVLSGHAFLRETRASASVASLSGLDPVPPADSDLPLNTNGFHWPAAFQRQVAGIDLTGAPAPACPALLIPARGDRRPGKLAATWRDAGAAVTELPFPDYEGWMQDPTTNQSPAATFAAITAWVAGLTPSPASVPTRPMATSVPIALTLADHDWVEEPVRFGPGQVLFGILCRPRSIAAAPVAALLLHEGSTHHIGNGRAYVRLARRLAAEGHASLRMDLTGMGDSPAGENTRHPHYDPERIAEGVAGIDRLAEAGFARVVAFGLCSGAHTALQVTLADPRVVGNVVLNLQKFIWHYGDDIRVAVRDNKRSLKGYLRAMRNPGEWRRMFAGEADLPGIARVLAKRSWTRARHAARSLLPPAPGSDTARAREQMRVLTDRRVHTTLVFSDEDPGLADLTMQFGARGRRIAGYAPARVVMLDQADHHFNGTAARRRFIDIAAATLRQANEAHGSDLPPVAPFAPSIEPPVAGPSRARTRAVA
ncbi:alpha/beta superfamily hydrolase [Sphingomonas insulae]|uniref:alpha/beta hydrolase n=1 Tax=Sphingomonas insulae TaxID=424800 RepID=UPI001ABB3C0B|nr:alpha/beta hydrolase [Sphingomonas insulae]NIJ28151.1 alpha/beta superfamily hydrolase [Sphingomonas insulae]